MSSEGLLLLLGFLTVWAELTPVSGQDRPKFCYLPADPGPCAPYTLVNHYNYYYNSTSNKCEEFIYGQCEGNANNFRTKDECHYACVEKPGACPQGTQRRPCLRKCENDWTCPGEQKCCRHGCLTKCKDPV